MDNRDIYNSASVPPPFAPVQQPLAGIASPIEEETPIEKAVKKMASGQQLTPQELQMLTQNKVSMGDIKGARETQEQQAKATPRQPRPITPVTSQVDTKQAVRLSPQTPQVQQAQAQPFVLPSFNAGLAVAPSPQQNQPEPSAPKKDVDSALQVVKDFLGSNPDGFTLANVLDAVGVAVSAKGGINRDTMLQQRQRAQFAQQQAKEMNQQQADLRNIELEKQASHREKEIALSAGIEDKKTQAAFAQRDKEQLRTIEASRKDAEEKEASALRKGEVDIANQQRLIKDNLAAEILKLDAELKARQKLSGLGKVNEALNKFVPEGM